jgi:hypothetical protein
MAKANKLPTLQQKDLRRGQKGRKHTENYSQETDVGF